jgi:tetratricopeptide (TPR) repeat protein
MIVKNEITNLEKCIDSIRGLVDEIVIADTGSNDGTAELVKKLAHRPLQYTWNDDFSAARNYTLEHATGDWVLILDADEHIRQANRKAFITALSRQDVIAYRIQYCSQLSDGRTGNELRFRLFRRLPTLRYSGRIHEQITPSINHLMTVEPVWNTSLLPGIVIDHEGYNPEKSDQKDRNDRNIRLLTIELVESPDDPYLHYKLSQCLEDISEGRKHLFKAAEIILSYAPEEIIKLAFAAELLTKASIEWTNDGYTDNALHACSVALTQFPDHPSTRLARGIACFKTGNMHMARTELEKALHMSPPDDFFYYDTASHNITASLLLADIFTQKKSYDKAIEILRSARQSYPSEEAIAVNLLKALLDNKQPEEVLKEGLGWLKNNPTPQCLLLCADAAELSGDIELAKKWRSRITGLS